MRPGEERIRPCGPARWEEKKKTGGSPAPSPHWARREGGKERPPTERWRPSSPTHTRAQLMLAYPDLADASA